MTSAEREKNKPEVIPIGFREVLVESVDDLQVALTEVFQSKFCESLKNLLDPVLIRLEQYTGRGGNMTQGYSQIALSRMKGKGQGSDGTNEDSLSPNGFINFQDDDDELVNLEEGRYGSGGGGAYRRHADASRRDDGTNRRASANNQSTSPSSLD